MKKIILIGATSAMAEHCARIWVQESPKEMVLVGRNAAKLERIAQDLRVRSPQSSVSCELIDFFDPARIQTWAKIQVEAGIPDIVLIAHGTLPDQPKCQEDLVLVAEAIAVNGMSPVLFAEAFASPMQRARCGTIAIIGSVAGDRGRKSNYVYGSAKGLVARYAQGLQHRLAGTGVSVVLVKPGPTDTPMTVHLKHSGAKLAVVDRVAREIVRGIENEQRVVYAPKIWSLIMIVIRHLPHFVFRRMDI